MRGLRPPGMCICSRHRTECTEGQPPHNKTTKTQLCKCLLSCKGRQKQSVCMYTETALIWTSFSNQVCHTDPRCHGFLPFQFQDILRVEVFYLQFCLCTCLCSVCGDQKRALDSLDLQLQKVVSCHVAARNQTRIHCKQLVLLATEPSSLQHPPLICANQIKKHPVQSQVVISSQSSVTEQSFQQHAVVVSVSYQ